MATERVDTLSRSNVPDPAVVVKGPRDDEVTAGVEAQRHYLGTVAKQTGSLLATLNIPKLAGDIIS